MKLTILFGILSGLTLFAEIKTVAFEEDEVEEIDDKDFNELDEELEKFDGVDEDEEQESEEAIEEKIDQVKGYVGNERVNRILQLMKEGDADESLVFNCLLDTFKENPDKGSRRFELFENYIQGGGEPELLVIYFYEGGDQPSINKYVRNKGSISTFETIFNDESFEEVQKMLNKYNELYAEKGLDRAQEFLNNVKKEFESEEKDDFESPDNESDDDHDSDKDEL